jgi:hypothetical protein
VRNWLVLCAASALASCAQTRTRLPPVRNYDVSCRESSPSDEAHDETQVSLRLRCENSRMVGIVVRNGRETKHAIWLDPWTLSRDTAFQLDALPALAPVDPSDYGDCVSRSLRPELVLLEPGQEYVESKAGTCFCRCFARQDMQVRLVATYAHTKDEPPRGRVPPDATRLPDHLVSNSIILESHAGAQ